MKDFRLVLHSMLYCITLDLLTGWMLYSLILLHEFGRGQHRYTLLGCGIKVYIDAAQLLSAVVWGTRELTRSSYVATKQYWQSTRYLLRCGEHVNCTQLLFATIILFCSAICSPAGWASDRERLSLWLSIRPSVRLSVTMTVYSSK